MGGGTNCSRDHATIEWPSRGEMVAVALCGTVERDEVEGEERGEDRTFLHPDQAWREVGNGSYIFLLTYVSSGR